MDDAFFSECYVDDIQYGGPPNEFKNFCDDISKFVENKTRARNGTVWKYSKTKTIL